MTPKDTAPGADKPTKLPTESKPGKNDDAPKDSIKPFHKITKPGSDAPPKLAVRPNQPTTMPIREAAPNPKESSGYKKTNSGDSVTSSMRVYSSDRDDAPNSREQTPTPRASDVAEDMMKGIGDIFGSRARQ